MPRIFTLIVLLTALWPALPLSAQQLTEAEVNTQKMFIEATREKLLDRPDKAIALFEQILDRDPDNAAAAFELGRLYFGQDKPLDAVRYLRTAREHDPGNEWYTRYLAEVYQATGQFTDAADLYAGLVEASPGDAERYFKQAYFLVRARRIEDAIAVYDQLEKRQGITEETSRRKHSLYLGLGDRKKAIRELEALIDAFPRQMEYRHLLAAYYESADERQEAARIYETILSLDPDNARAQLAVSQSGSEQSDENRFFSRLEPVFRRTDVSLDDKIKQLIPAINQVADKGNRELADALLTLTAVLEEVHPDAAQPYAAAGDIYFNTGRYAQAADKYEATLSRDESVYPVWEQLLTSYYHTANMQQLAGRAGDAVDVFPNQPILYYYLGMALGADGRPDEAMDWLQQAEMMSSRNPQLLAQIQALQAQLLAAGGDTERAGQLLDQAAAGRKDPLLQLHRAQWLQARGQAEEARKAAAAAVEQAPADLYLRAGYAQILYQGSRYTEARAQLDELISLDRTPNWPNLLELYGDTLFQLGHTDQAVSYWTKARDRGSRSRDLPKKIAERQLNE